MYWVQWDRINSVPLWRRVSQTPIHFQAQNLDLQHWWFARSWWCVNPFLGPRFRTFVCIHPRCRGDATGALPWFDTPNKVGIATPSVSPIPVVQPSLMRACSAIFIMACATNVLPPTLPMASLWNAFGETALSTGSPSSKHLCSSMSPCS